MYIHVQTVLRKFVGFGELSIFISPSENLKKILCEISERIIIDHSQKLNFFILYGKIKFICNLNH